MPCERVVAKCNRGIRFAFICDSDQEGLAYDKYVFAVIHFSTEFDFYGLAFSLNDFILCPAFKQRPPYFLRLEESSSLQNGWPLLPAHWLGPTLPSKPTGMTNCI